MQTAVYMPQITRNALSFISLTPRELDVLTLLTDDLTNLNIADKLFVTRGAVW